MGRQRARMASHRGWYRRPARTRGIDRPACGVREGTSARRGLVTSATRTRGDHDTNGNAAVRAGIKEEDHGHPIHQRSVSTDLDGVGREVHRLRCGGTWPATTMVARQHVSSCGHLLASDRPHWDRMSATPRSSVTMSPALLAPQGTARRSGSPQQG